MVRTNEKKNVLIAQTNSKIPFHLALVHILYNLLLLKGHAQTAKHHMSATKSGDICLPDQSFWLLAISIQELTGVLSLQILGER